MSLTFDTSLAALDTDELLGFTGERPSDVLDTFIANALYSVDSFSKSTNNLTDMTGPKYILLRDVVVDAVPANRIVLGRIGDNSVDSQRLRNRCYNSFFILNDSISQDMSVYRKPSVERTQKSVDDNVFDLSLFSFGNPFKNMTTSEFRLEVESQINLLSRQISLDDNTSDFVQTFKKDANVSPEDYKKLKVRQSPSTELRGLNRKRSTSV
jgi:hypothetical protein